MIPTFRLLATFPKNYKIFFSADLCIICNNSAFQHVYGVVKIWQEFCWNVTIPYQARKQFKSCLRHDSLFATVQYKLFSHALELKITKKSQKNHVSGDDWLHIIAILLTFYHTIYSPWPVWLYHPCTGPALLLLVHPSACVCLHTAMDALPPKHYPSGLQHVGRLGCSRFKNHCNWKTLKTILKFNNCNYKSAATVSVQIKRNVFNRTSVRPPLYTDNK